MKIDHSAIIDWFIPVKIQQGDADILRRIRLAVAFGLVNITAGSTYASIYLVMGKLYSVTVIMSVCLLTVGNLLFLRRTASHRIFSHVLIGCLHFTLSFLACLEGGFGSSPLLWYAVMPLLAISAGGMIAARIWTGITALSLVGFYLFSGSGVFTSAGSSLPGNDLFYLLVSVGLIGIVMIAANLYESSKTRALRQLEIVSRKALASSEAKSQFLANMSHEIRTPMTAINGFAEELLEDLGCCGTCDSHGSCSHIARSREYLEIISSNGNYLLQLINDILDLSKIEAGKLSVERIRCSPAEILAEVQSLTQVRAEAKGLNFKMIQSGVIPEFITGDPTRLRQVLINLVGNAIKFTEVGGIQLLVKYFPEGNVITEDTPGSFLQFDIVDTGIGITPEQATDLFNPFQQADSSTTRKYGGSGLGLTISLKLTRLLGGDLTLLESRPGEGSRFRATVVTGPLAGVRMLDDILADSMVDHERRQGEADAGSDLTCRILLVDDSGDNQLLIRRLLEKAGATVTVEGNGRLVTDAALAAWREGQPFDVILMDMMMPVMDGYQATALLRESGYPGSIIALTANAMTEDRERCLQVGCDDYATKPVNRQLLIGLIRELLPEMEPVS